MDAYLFFNCNYNILALDIPHPFIEFKVTDGLTESYIKSLTLQDFSKI